MVLRVNIIDISGQKYTLVLNQNYLVPNNLLQVLQ